MRIDELKKEVESLGRIYDVNIVVQEKAGYLFVTKYESRCYSTIATVSLKNEFRLNTNTKAFEKLPKEVKKELLNILTEFARTPIDEREEEKKYLITHRFLFNRSYCGVNLVWNQELDMCRAINRPKDEDDDIDKVLFTKEEIEKIKERFNTDLTDFRIVEVE